LKLKLKGFVDATYVDEDPIVGAGQQKQLDDE